MTNPKRLKKPRRVDNIKAGGVQLSEALTEYGLGATVEASSPEVKGVQQDQLEAEYQAQLTAATEVENFVVVDALGMSQVKTFAITSPDEDAIWTLDEPRGATVEWQTTVVDETAKINILIESLQVDGTWYPITVATNVAAFAERLASVAGAFDADSAPRRPLP